MFEYNPKQEANLHIQRICISLALHPQPPPHDHHRSYDHSKEFQCFRWRQVVKGLQEKLYRLKGHTEFSFFLPSFCLLANSVEKPLEGAKRNRHKDQDVNSKNIKEEIYAEGIRRFKPDWVRRV